MLEKQIGNRFVRGVWERKDLLVVFSVNGLTVLVKNTVYLGLY